LLDELLCWITLELLIQDGQAARDNKRQSAVAAFETLSQRAAASALPASAELADDDVVRMVKESR
jgi:hypothetical protein